MKAESRKPKASRHKRAKHQRSRMSRRRMRTSWFPPGQRSSSTKCKVLAGWLQNKNN